MNVATASKQELQDEITRLQKELKEREAREWDEAEEASRQRIERLRNFGVDAVDLLAPQHGRSSCSDSDIGNSWGSAENGAFRCLRCALLDIVRENYDPPGVVLFEINVIVKRRK